jgi:hypothetical protein
MMQKQIHNKTIACKRMPGFIILDVTPICYVKAPDTKTSDDVHLTNKFGKLKLENSLTLSNKELSFVRQHLFGSIWRQFKII